jgi:Condensin II non structural maintenance of chromosomes subunit/HEAT repeat
MAKNGSRKILHPLSKSLNEKSAPTSDVQSEKEDGVRNISVNAASTLSFDKVDLEIATNALLDTLTTVNDNDHEPNIRPFLNLFGAACSNVHVPVLLKQSLGWSMKEQHQLLYTTVRQLKNGDIALSIFTTLRKYVQHFTEQQISLSSSDESDHTDATHDTEMTHPARLFNDTTRTREVFLFLYYVTSCATAYFEGWVTKNKPSPNSPVFNEVYHIATSLHAFIDTIDESTSSKEVRTAHQAIVTLCETWWLKNGVQKESLIGNILPILVGNVLKTESSKGADMKRLYSIRSAFSIIDFDDPESQSFVFLLLRLISSPICIKNPDGKRFIAFLMSANDLGSSTIRQQVHQSIRAQIPENKKSILLQYSDIYFGAWKNSMSDDHDDDETKNGFEVEILSDLAYASIYAAKSSLIQSMHVVLSKFYDQKQVSDVATLLYRLYTPIIWRALVAPNPIVRMNAVSVVLLVFPLSSSTSDVNSSSTKVYTSLQQLLQDPDPRVRCTTANVVSEILSIYWDGIPSKYIRLLLNRTYSRVLFFRFQESLT